MRKSNFFISVFVFSAIQVYAQQKWDRPMELKSCSIDIKADMFTATTFIEMEFCNPNDREIEGLHRFELKPGQVITAFQLDLNGKYRDGSIEEKWKATNAYNTIVGKRIDPALLTMEYADHYSLRIYPVPAKGCRKVTMTIQQLLVREKNHLVYSLPLNINDAVPYFKLNIAVNGNNTPATRSGLIAGQSFSGGSQQYSLQWNTEKVLLKNPVAFSMPLSSSTFYCTKITGQQTHFALHLRPSYPTEYEVAPKQLTVFWDVSSSSSKRDINKEISFLRQFIAYHRITQLTILPFNYKVLDTAVFNINDNKNRWQEFLQNLEYSGSTQLGCIDLSLQDADMYMLFTDGNNTYGKGKPKTGVALVYAIYTSNSANLTVLNDIVGSSGGKVVDLNKITLSSAIAINSKAENWLLSITSASGRTIVEQTLPLKLNESLLVNGTMNVWNDTLFFHYGNNNRVTKVEKVIINAEKQCPSTAIDRVSMLNNFDRVTRSNVWENILEFGLQEKVVTPNTAYIVLERIEDYVRYNIAPPKELEEACEKMNYVKKDTRPQRKQLQQADEFTILSGVINMYNERIKRWDVNERAISLNRMDFDKEKNLQVKIETTNTGTAKNESINGVMASGDAGFTDSRNNELSEVVVTGYGSMRKSSMTGAATSIQSRELQSGYFSTVEQALQGRVAGVQVNSTGNGFLNQQYKANIRGISSMNGNNEPLYVLDGIPVSGNINNVIHVNDIESITVLKDASAAALYGSRAANGAVVITSKKGKEYYRNSNKPYRLKDMDDVDYLAEIKDVPYKEKKAVYQRLKKQHEDNAGFYFDMAQHFFESGLQEEAMDLLMNAAEASNGSYQVLRAMGYVLESWKRFDEATKIYQQLLDDYPINLYSYRDLAWAHYQQGSYQQAVNVLYTGIKYNYLYYSWWNLSLKALMLSELNAMIALHKEQLDISEIPASLIRLMPADLRIVLDCNKGSLGGVSIREPGGAVCNYSKQVTRNGGTLNTEQYGYSYYSNAPAEYQIKEAPGGKYKVSLNYYDYYSYPGKIPAFVRMVTFRNFGKEGQSIKVENVIMDNQYGEVEIGEVRW
ncbi:MAG TPA: TonB-dependent receptor plug domain-containing protein [Chitinophagaceae bacterium]